jgi:hypothetical protein
MLTTEGFQSLICKILRGAIIFRILRIVFIALAGFALYLGSYSWALLAFLVAVSCSLLLQLVLGRRYAGVWKVSTDPKVVYWAHPTPGFDKSIDAPISECRHITLHLRDGTYVEIDLTVSQMKEFVAWLTEHNPSIRCGRYDNSGYADN